MPFELRVAPGDRVARLRGWGNDDYLSTQEALERVAAALELPLEWVADSPYVLVGTADEIATTLREHHERFGISRWTLFVDKPGAPPVEELAALVERVAAA